MNNVKQLLKDQDERTGHASDVEDVGCEDEGRRCRVTHADLGVLERRDAPSLRQRNLGTLGFHHDKCSEKSTETGQTNPPGTSSVTGSPLSVRCLSTLVLARGRNCYGWSSLRCTQSIMKRRNVRSWLILPQEEGTTSSGFNTFNKASFIGTFLNKCIYAK